MTKRPITTTDDPSRAWAEKLWNKARTDALGLQQAIIAIIAARAWEPLGYESFAKAWVDKMSDITIAVELQPHVVYELLETLTPEQVADAVKGISPDSAQLLAEQKKHGVPPAVASRRRISKRSPVVTLFLKMTRRQLGKYRAIADQHNTTVEDVAHAAIQKAFDELSQGA